MRSARPPHQRKGRSHKDCTQVKTLNTRVDTSHHQRQGQAGDAGALSTVIPNTCAWNGPENAGVETSPYQGRKASDPGAKRLQARVEKRPARPKMVRHRCPKIASCFKKDKKTQKRKITRDSHEWRYLKAEARDMERFTQGFPHEQCLVCCIRNRNSALRESSTYFVKRSAEFRFRMQRPFSTQPAFYSPETR